MKNKQYELYLMQHVTGSVEDDFITRYIDSFGNYRVTVKAAREFSKHIGESVVNGYKLNKVEKIGWSHPLDEGLAAVKIVCHIETTETSYNVVFEEYFKGGKSLGKEYW